MEREKGRERITTSCEYERESCQKVVKKWLSKYHFSNQKCSNHFYFEGSLLSSKKKTVFNLQRFMICLDT
jgi:hypothetical protein